jgi:phosphonate transport system substrate-binding protein
MNNVVTGGDSSRRRFLQVLASAPLLPFATTSRTVWATAAPLSIGLTPVFLDDQMRFLESWRTYLETQLQRPVQFLQRGSYSEVLRLLRDGRVDFAWLCGFPYWRNRDWLKLVAVPVYQGQPLYRSYLIHNAQQPPVASLAELRGKVFAYSDPDSNSGFLYPQYRLRTMQEDSRHFFGRSFFTWSHRKVVEAVAVQLATAGAVDGYVWDVLAQLHPALTGQTTIFERSPEFGFPPVVAAKTVDAATFEAFQALLLGMQDDPEGQALLKTLAMDGFTRAEPELFASIGAMITES